MDRWVLWVYLFLFFLCCDWCLKEEVGMVEVGSGSGFSQVQCCWVLLVVRDRQCLGSILLGFSVVVVGVLGFWF